MSSNAQEKMTKYLDFPFDTFLMLRFEYEVIFDDELVVKLLRIIEYYIEAERRRIYREKVNKNGTPDEPLDITRDIWVPLSYKLFMSDLYGKVTSENTIKRALNYLVDHRIVFRRHEPKKRYDAPLYTINHAALQMLITLTRGGQKLIPSVLDALKNSPPQFLTPSEYQKLIPSEVDLSVNDQSRVSIFDPTFKKSNNITLEESNAIPTQSANADAHAQPTSLSVEAMIAHLQSEGYAVLPLTEPNLTERKTPSQEELSAENQDHLKSTMSVPDMKQEETGRADGSYSQRSSTNAAAEEKSVTRPGVMTPTKAPGPDPEVESVPASTPVSQKEAETVERSSKKAAQAVRHDLLTEASPGAESVVQEWCGLFKKPVVRDAKLISAAETLAAYEPEPGEVTACYNWLWTTDRSWYAKHGGVTLGVVASKFPGFRSLSCIPDPGGMQSFSAKALALADDWDGICGEKQPRRENMAVFEELAQVDATREKMRLVRESLLAEDYWYKRGVGPRDLLKHFHRATKGSTSLKGYSQSPQDVRPDFSNSYKPQSRHIPASVLKQQEREKQRAQQPERSITR